MISGYDHLTYYDKRVDADHNFWMKHVYRNFDVALNIIILILHHTKLFCVICEDHSLNFHTQGSLASHYRYTHKRQVAEYYINHFVEKTPEELNQMLENTTYSVNDIVGETIRN